MILFRTLFPHNFASRCVRQGILFFDVIIGIVGGADVRVFEMHTFLGSDCIDRYTVYTFLSTSVRTTGFQYIVSRAELIEFLNFICFGILIAESVEGLELKERM